MSKIRDKHNYDERELRELEERTLDVECDGVYTHCIVLCSVCKRALKAKPVSSLYSRYDILPGAQTFEAESCEYCD